MQCIKYLWSDLRFQRQIYKRDGNAKSLAQVWNCSRKEVAMVKSQDWQSQKYGKTENVSELKCWIIDLYFILSIGIPYNQEGCNIGSLTWSKVLIGYPSENPEGKPCKTNSKILGWLILVLVDQMKPFNWGLLFSDLDRFDWSGGPVWPV
jgi:hypothetical protein